MLQEMVNSLNEAMQAIQGLQLAPTEHNCTRIVTALNSIRQAAQRGVEMNNRIKELEKPTTEESEVKDGE